jgi:hypothetical protein
MHCLSALFWEDHLQVLPLSYIRFFIHLLLPVLCSSTLVAILCIFSVSSFQLNLASLTLGAKEHLARLDASAGGAFRARLQSPLATASVAAHSQPPAVGAAVTFASSSVGGVAGSASVGLEGGVDLAGEHFLKTAALAPLKAQRNIVLMMRSMTTQLSRNTLLSQANFLLA